MINDEHATDTDMGVLAVNGVCVECCERDVPGGHANGCYLGLGPDEVDYRCPKCERAAPWTDGIDIPPFFWCQTCGAETPLELCEVVARD